MALRDCIRTLDDFWAGKAGELDKKRPQLRFGTVFSILGLLMGYFRLLLMGCYRKIRQKAYIYGPSSESAV